MHIPFMSMCQFIFYMGWMKVAEVIMNPFGDDDDDLEINWLIDRNLQVGMTIADETWEPQLIKDQYWMVKTAEPMYSVDAVKERYNPQVGSVSNIKWAFTLAISISDLDPYLFDFYFQFYFKVIV
ncbi:unnamed protein product [Gongylonema pulchrum]|uniref:Bestrophin homolog n=1 Tax=Gongylonema pulchrum TaxID=637853 RepID=A0A183DKY4_9BILA|nr:unnamed protein product [Gongylonema pulchrum]